ncbi:hypothetical protein V8C86DRAFT_2595714 [Haematococcus lacustris]
MAALPGAVQLGAGLVMSAIQGAAISSPWHGHTTSKPTSWSWYKQTKHTQPAQFQQQASTGPQSVAGCVQSVVITPTCEHWCSPGTWSLCDTPTPTPAP